MVEAAPQPPTVRFGPYEADLGTGELRREGTKVPLQDKPFQMLALLLRRPGELVTREELRSELWPADTFVDFEHGLNTAVKKLRQALDDSAETPKFVETLPKRGYRFVAPSVSGLEAAPPAASAEAPRRKPWRLHGPWAVVVIALVGLLLWPHRRAGDVAPPPPLNARPVIVLMDSPLPGRVYDPRTFAAGGTNADDLTDGLQELPVTIQKENTSAMWRRRAGGAPEPGPDHQHLSRARCAGRSAEERPSSITCSPSLRTAWCRSVRCRAENQQRFIVYSRGIFAERRGHPVRGRRRPALRLRGGCTRSASRWHGGAPCGPDHGPDHARARKRYGAAVTRETAQRRRARSTRWRLVDIACLTHPIEAQKPPAAGGVNGQSVKPIAFSSGGQVVITRGRDKLQRGS